MKIKEKITKDYQLINILAIPIIIYTIYLLVSILSSTIHYSSFPNEFREAANIQMTQAILDGNNPYSLETLESAVPGVFYLYGPLFSLCVAFFALFLPIDLVLLHYLVTFAAMILSAALLAIIVSDHSYSITAPCIAFLFTIMCHWRYGYVYAAPDSFGLMILILILFLLTRKPFKLCPLITAFLTVALFFTKQYYALFAVIGFLFFLFRSKKDALKYALDGILISLVAFLIMQWKFPLFWTYTLYFIKGPGLGVSKSSSGTTYNMLQISYLGGMFFFLFLVVAFDFLRIFIWKRCIRLQFNIRELKQPLIKITTLNDEQTYGRRRVSIDILFWIQLVISALCLQYLGRNNGAWISYYLQLFMPPLIILSITSLDNYLQTDILSLRSRHSRFMLIGYFCFYLLFLSVTIVKTNSRLVVNEMNAEEKDNWEKAYTLLNQYCDNEMYYLPVLAYHGFEHEQYMYNTGQPFVITEKYLDKHRKNTTAQILFPHAEEIMEQHLNYRKEICEKVERGDYSLIMNMKDTDVVFTEKQLMNQYQKETTLSLCTGNWSWDIDFWTRKDNIK